MKTSSVVLGVLTFFQAWTEATQAPSMLPTPEPSFFPTHIPTNEPTVAPSAPTSQPTPPPSQRPTEEPTSRPTHSPTPMPSKTPKPSSTPGPTPGPSLSPTPNPTVSPTLPPTPAPTFDPTLQPSVTKEPTPQPTLKPTPLPSITPTTVADYFPMYHVTALVKCLDEAGVAQAGASNHTYGLSLKAQVREKIDNLTVTAPVEYATNPDKALFRGLGRVNAMGHPVDFDEFNSGAGDKSCDPSEGGGASMLALIHDYPIGSAGVLEFENVATGDPISTQADASFELTEVCLDQRTGGGKPHGHDGVSVEFIVQRFDVVGSTTFVANASLDMFRSAGSEDPGLRCAFLHPLEYDMKLTGWRNLSMLVQDAIPWEMTLNAEFDAEINLLAFKWNDNATDRRERAALTLQHGEYLTSLTELGDYNYTKQGKDGFSDAHFEARAQRRRLVSGYALTTAYEPYGEGAGVELCDDACVASGGAYQSWHPHLVIQWNVSASVGNTESNWQAVQSSTWGKPLKIRDERRYFAVTYDRTPPSVEVNLDSVKFTYSYNISKCGSAQYVLRSTVKDNDGMVKESTPFADRLNVRTGFDETMGCLPTSTTDMLEMNFTGNEEGTYYFYAHPSFDQVGLERNFSGLVGHKWPFSIVETGLYGKHVMCGPDSIKVAAGDCDSVGNFPREERLVVPMDAEAFIFGYDFSYSEFAIYHFAEDDGWASENSGFGLNSAQGFSEFKQTYGNASGSVHAEHLLWPQFVEDISYHYVDADRTITDDPPVRTQFPLTSRANYFNESVWSASRFLVNSAKDSNLSQVISLVPDEEHGFTSEFGTVAKVFFTLSHYADEFDYTSHRGRFYSRIENDQDAAIDADNVYRNNVNTYMTNTDSFIAYQNSIGRGQNQIGKKRLFPQIRVGYNLTRNPYMETVFVPHSSNSAEAVASHSPSGEGTAPIILGLNVTSIFSDSHFYMVGQRDDKADGDQMVYAQVRLLYSNDPLFQHVPVDSVAQVGIWNYDLDSLLPDSKTVMDDTGYSPPRSLPVVNVTVKNNIDYTTDTGGLCTLLVSLTEQPTGIVKFNVGVPNKDQAQLYQGKTPVLLFSPDNYQDLEVTLEGLDDHDNSNGDVPFDVVFAIADTQDPRFLYRHDEFNFAVSLTNLATKDDVRLAIGFNTTFCQTSERGGWCDVPLQVCAHNANANGGFGPGGLEEPRCDDKLDWSLANGRTPFASAPVFTSGVDKIVVKLNVSNVFESKITGVSGNGRFDSSSSTVDCDQGARGSGHGSLDGGCVATVVFKPLSSGDDEEEGTRAWQGDGQGPYIAYVRLQGVDDFVVDGLQDNLLSISYASVVRGREKTDDFVLYQEAQVVKNVDDDTSKVRWGPNRAGASYAPSRYLEVSPASCSTSEDANVGACPVTVTASFELLNNSVTSALDTVECAKVSLDMTWYFDNATSPDTAVKKLTQQFSQPTLRAGPLLDYYGAPPRLQVSEKFTTHDGRSPYNLGGWSVVDIPWSLKGGQEEGGLNAAYRAREDFCLPPGNMTGTFTNATTLYLPNGGSPEGGWVASVIVSGTETVLWSSLGLPNHPNADQLGNFTFEVPVAGIPIVLQGVAPLSMELEVKVASASAGKLNFTKLATNAGTSTTVTSELDKTMTWACSATCQVSFELDSSDDDVDDDDEEFSVTATVKNVTLGTPSEGESIITLNRKSQWTVLPVTHYDDDTAGLLLEALDSPPLRSYRTDLLRSSDTTPSNSKAEEEGWVSGRRFFGMKYNTTSEGYRLDMFGDPQHSNATYFNVSLTSQPRHDVVVTVKATPVQNEWGWQFEGVPAEGYVIKSYESPSMWIKGTNDSVVDPWRGGLDLTFTADNWMIPKRVVVWGLDDFLDDGDRDYTLTLDAVSMDKYYDSGASKNSWANMSKLEVEQFPREDAYMPQVVVPMRNLDDDKASFVAVQNGTRCSEPFYDYDAAVQFYLTSKPVSLVSVWLASSDPAEAGPAQSLVGITRDNWETMKEVRVKSVDDFVADGNVNFTVTVDLFYSIDAQYSNPSLYEGMAFDFVSMDDPNDGLGMGAAVEVALTSDLDYTTALGGTISVGVKLSYMPQAPVYVTATTSNQLQAVVTSIPTLVFTAENFAVEQAVEVMGVDDGERDGDTMYQVILGLESTDDPYYDRFAFGPKDKTVVHNVLSQDYPWARVRLALSVDAVTTKEDDVTTGSFTSVTVGVCQALFGPVETGGVPGTQAVDLVVGSVAYGSSSGSDLCSGFWLNSEELFGTTSDPRVSFVTAVVEVSNTSQATLSCDPTAAAACATSFDGKTATLVFDRTTNPNLSSFTSQLRLVGVDDFTANGDASFEVAVVSASVKYFKERHEVTEGYLPKPLVLTNVDDDRSEFERNAWYTVSPAVGCAVFESSLEAAEQQQKAGSGDGQVGGDGNCVLDFSFYDAMKRSLGGEVYAFTVTVDVAPMGSDVYIDSVPMISAGLNWNSTCELGTVGCTTMTLSFVESESDNNPTDLPFKKLYLLDNPDDPLIRFGNMSAQIALGTVDDSWDDGDEAFQVVTDGLVGYNCTNGTLFLDCGTYVDNSNLTYTIEGMEYDDDTAGLVFTQGGNSSSSSTTSFLALRTGRMDGTDSGGADDTSLRTISLPNNVTSESGRETVSFGVALSAKPSEEVNVAITTQLLDDEWGLDRVEGVPTLNGSLTDGGGYTVGRYKSAAAWLNSTGSKDFVTNKDTGRTLLTFTPSNWNVPQNVTVIGLDDLAADGDKEYNLYAKVDGTAGDMYHYDPAEQGFEEPVRVPLLNLDDEQKTPGWVVKQNGVYVGEPFYGYVGSIDVYPLTEPSDVIMLSFSSNKPWIANTSETLVVISPSDWDQTKTVYVTAVDNFLDDGNIGFEVEMLMLGSSDQMYGDLIMNKTFAFTKLDDPEDSLYEAGVGMEFQIGENLYGVRQPFTTEYGGDGMLLDEVAKTGSATVQARLMLKPQDVVTYSLSVSDTSEAQVLYPSVVVFTPDNWDQYQEVVVLGRSDGLVDGDVDYDLQFNLLGTNDPYYRVLSLNSTRFTLTNQDTIEQRLALGISSLGCYNVTEGDGLSRGFQIPGDASCTVTLSLCLSDAGSCTKKLTAQEVYNNSESLGIDSVSIWAFVKDRRVAQIAAPTLNFGQVNVTANGTEAHVSLGVGRALETAFNLSVIATDDTKDEYKQLNTQLTFYGVLMKNGKAVQEFVDYYDDFGDVTSSAIPLMGSLKGTDSGGAVRTGSVPIQVRDDETPRVVFHKTSPGCNTGEYGRIDTPGQSVSDGTCVLYLRLGAKPVLGVGQEVEITVASSASDAGLFAMSSSEGGTDFSDSVDMTPGGAFPETFVDSFTVSFTAENWNVPVKVVLVGQDDTQEEGNQYYVVTATVDSSPDAAYQVGTTVEVGFWNLEDDTNLLNVTQWGQPVGSRTAKDVDEAGWKAEACRAFTVVVAEDLWLSGLGDSNSLKSTLTLTSSDHTEGKVGTSCDPDPTNNYGRSLQVDPESVFPPLNFITKPGRGAIFYYIGVDDDENDGDVEFSITVTVERPSYTTAGVTTEGEAATYSFFVTNRDDDSLLVANPLVLGERESKLTSDVASGDYTLRLFEPSECPTGGSLGCADACAATQADGANYEPISCSEPLEGVAGDLSVASNRTGKLSFSYPDLGTWNDTDFTKSRVTFDFTSNVGRFQLNFGVKGDAATNCSDADMQDWSDPRSQTCWVDFDEADQTLFMFVTALADDIDRGDFVESYLNVRTEMFYRSSVGASDTFASGEVSLFDRPVKRPFDGDVVAKSARSQRILLSLVEDDLSGVVVNQTQASGIDFGEVAYRSGVRNALVQDPTATTASITLPMATTHEAGGNVSFSVALSSEPLVGAYVYVWAEQVARSDGSETRYEGIPWPASYEWEKFHPEGHWSRRQVEDVVPLKGWMEGHKRLLFTPGDWRTPQHVSIMGLNDLYDDSTVNYNIYLTTESHSAELDPWYDLVSQVALPLENTDNDDAGLGAYWDDYSKGPTFGIVSEPYLGLGASLFFYLKSKPTAPVLVTVVSSAPAEAESNVNVVSIGPSNWDTATEAKITGVDDRLLTGTANFTMTVSVVYSADSDYGTLAANADGVVGRMVVGMDGYALDDPTDHPATACGKGELGTYGVPKSNCTLCKKGTYADSVGDKVSCRQCPPGTFGAYQGSFALTAATDYDGSMLPPGCLPCPNGTYSSEFGATRCVPCPDGKHCWPLATVTPQDAQPWERYSTSFDKRWTQVSSTDYKATVSLGGETQEMNRDQYEAYLVISGFGAWLLLGGVLLGVYCCASHSFRDKMIRFFRAIDLFPRAHEEIAKNERHADAHYAPSAVGGVVSFGVLMLGLITTSIMFFVYVNYNVVATSSLDVFNTTFVDKVKIDVSAKVSFVGYSGCANSTYLPGTIGEATVPEMMATGVTFENRSTEYQCNNGNLDMRLNLEGLKVATNPKFFFSVQPDCLPCSDSLEAPRFPGNTVFSCPACTVASAQAIKYSVKASNNYGESPDLHLKDDNFVNGSEVPDSRNQVFRGSDPTQVKVFLMPAEYENRRSWKKFKSYRLVYAESDLGSTQGFEGAYEFYGEGYEAQGKGALGTTVGGGEARNFTAPENFERWVKEDSWAAEGAKNEVRFTLDMPLATSRVTVLVDNQETFLDLWAQLGGVLGLLVALMLVGMHLFERSHDTKDPVGSRAKALAKWYSDKASAWHERRNPEPTTWAMENIDRMREKEGGGGGGGGFGVGGGGMGDVEMSSPRKPPPQSSALRQPSQPQLQTGGGGGGGTGGGDYPQEADSSSSRMFQRNAASKSGKKGAKSPNAAASRRYYEQEDEEENYEDEVDDFHGQL